LPIKRKFPTKKRKVATKKRIVRAVKRVVKKVTRAVKKEEGPRRITPIEVPRAMIKEILSYNSESPSENMFILMLSTG
jgi:hypothetical protein